MEINSAAETARTFAQISMKTHPIIVLLLATLLQGAFAEDTERGAAVEDAESRVDQNAKLINMAILTLPDHLVSDLPRNERGGLLRLFCQDSAGRGRLDYGNGFVDYYRDGAAEGDTPSGSCRFWMKIFRAEDGTPFLFVHNYRPNSTKEMSALFRCGKYLDFTDVTSDYLAEVVDLSRHLRPQREFDTIRVAEYEEYQRKNENGKEEIFHRVGPQVAELIWTGVGFELRKVEQTKIPHLDHLKKRQ